MQLIDAPGVVAATVLSNYFESCVWRIMESDIQTVDQAIESFNSSVGIHSENTTDILNRLLNLSCPGQSMCSEHGSCIDAICICNEGYFFCFAFAARIYL